MKGCSVNYFHSNMLYRDTECLGISMCFSHEGVVFCRLQCSSCKQNLNNVHDVISFYFILTFFGCKRVMASKIVRYELGLAGMLHGGI